MLKYAQIVDKNTGLCNVGIGNDIVFYVDMGFELLDVEQSDIDGFYYLAEKCPMKTEEQKEIEEKERIAKLSMTKYDFFKYVCSPYEITYAKLTEFVTSSDEVAAAWNLCARVYRGDETLCKSIKQVIPVMTDNKLDEIFKTYGE
jgi:hypothetical protein